MSVVRPVVYHLIHHPLPDAVVEATLNKSFRFKSVFHASRPAMREFVDLSLAAREYEARARRRLSIACLECLAP